MGGKGGGGHERKRMVEKNERKDTLPASSYETVPFFAQGGVDARVFLHFDPASLGRVECVHFALPG